MDVRQESTAAEDRYTALGVLWNLLEPLLYLGVLSVVFSYVNRMRMSDYAVFLFSGLVPWRYFEKVVSGCTDAIVQGDWLLKTLPASPFSLPLSRWMVASVEFGCSFAAVAVILLLVKAHWTVHVAILPLAMLPWALTALGVGLCCATLFIFFRDVRPVVQLALMFAFFTAPILFTPDLFPPGSAQARLLAWHPLTYLAALFQKPVHAGLWPGPMDWAVSSARRAHRADAGRRIGALGAHPSLFLPVRGMTVSADVFTLEHVGVSFRRNAIEARSLKYSLASWLRGRPPTVHAALADVSLSVAARGAARHHRPERRREVDAAAGAGAGDRAATRPSHGRRDPAHRPAARARRGLSPGSLRR